MAKLDSLIRVRKHVVEQKQKFLAELYRQSEELLGQKNTMLSQLDEERETVKELGVQMLSYFGPYAEAVRSRVEEIDQSMETLNARIEIAREDMRGAFAEMKKIELTKEAREAEEKAEIDKKESNELDEIGIESFRRKRAEED